jgi:hypothetical protein
MKRNLLAMAAIAVLPNLLFAQTTETFEGVTASTPNVKPTTFVSNGQSFTLTTDNCATGGIFGVWIPGQVYANCNSTNSTNDASTTYGVGTSCTGGSCTGSSAKFIDDGGTNATVLTAGHLYGIKTTNSAAFTIKTMFIYLSSNGSVSPSDAGGLTITGKLAGATVFTYTKTTGFNTSLSTNSGFTYLDFSAGTNYTNSNIDELQIQSPNANYVALDNFRWGVSVPLALDLISFNAQQFGNAVQLNWTASKESDAFEYQIEKSNDGKSFTMLNTVAANNTGVYRFDDAAITAGNYFYKLKMISKDGSSTYSDVKNVFIDARFAIPNVYPNPTKDVLYATVSGATVLNIQITDYTGRIVKKGELSTESNSINIASLKSGIYFYQTSDALTGAVISKGKITKL